jgi:hypothetical protein
MLMLTREKLAEIYDRYGRELPAFAPGFIPDQDAQNVEPQGPADAFFQFFLVEAVAGYTRYQHYQVTDGNGNYGYADVNHQQT